MTTLILAASPSQANWDQANAFEEGQQRVAIGKDPMPGPRGCAEFCVTGAWVTAAAACLRN
ncbi:hypothetical protein EGJ86_24660 [Pseudomonas sp. o96-267]|nr:hypothetical protein EGJ86_24660 [Pseudomonas sp. o96-267]